MNNPIVPKGPIYHDRDDKKHLESRNGIIQTEFVLHTASTWGTESRLTPDLVRETQRLAVNQIYRCAGHFRNGEVRIEGVSHKPPAPAEVPDLVQGMCDYLHSNWDASPVHLASYVMWRLNWIHPFFGGNGRTVRAMSYLILCAKLGFALPGRKTIPELIVDSREPYYRALQAADAAWEQSRMDVSRMEELMSRLLAIQLVEIHGLATGEQS